MANFCKKIIQNTVDVAEVTYTRPIASFQANVNTKTETGVSPLQLAACHGHLAIAQLLIQRRADIHATNDTAATCLFDAVEGGHTQVTWSNYCRVLLPGDYMGVSSGEDALHIHIRTVPA